MIAHTHTSIDSIYRTAVSTSPKCLRTSEEHDAAATDIRDLIERTVLVTGAKRRDVEVALHGPLAQVRACTKPPLDQ